jgi:hypothetical protein
MASGNGPCCVGGPAAVASANPAKAHPPPPRPAQKSRWIRAGPEDPSQRCSAAFFPGGRRGGSRPAEAADGEACDKTHDRSLGLPDLLAESPMQCPQLDPQQESEGKTCRGAKANTTKPWVDGAPCLGKTRGRYRRSRGSTLIDLPHQRSDPGFHDPIIVRSHQRLSGRGRIHSTGLPRLLGCGMRWIQSCLASSIKRRMRLDSMLGRGRLWAM